MNQAVLGLMNQGFRFNEPSGPGSYEPIGPGSHERSGPRSHDPNGPGSLET